MRRLSRRATSPAYFAQLHAPVETTSFELAPAGAPTTSALPDFDVISGGAIANALLFALTRLLGAKGQGACSTATSATSNLNRNAVLCRSALGVDKVEDLARLAAEAGVMIEPRPIRFAPGIRRRSRLRAP